MTSTIVRTAIVLALGFLALSTVAAGQLSPAVGSATTPQQSVISSLQLKPQLVPADENKNSAPQRVAISATAAPTKASAEPAAAR